MASSSPGHSSSWVCCSPVPCVVDRLSLFPSQVLLALVPKKFLFFPLLSAAARGRCLLTNCPMATQGSSWILTCSASLPTLCNPLLGSASLFSLLQAVLAPPTRLWSEVPADPLTIFCSGAVTPNNAFSPFSSLWSAGRGSRRKRG